MDSTEKKQSPSEAEVARTFEILGLTEQQEREKFLFHEFIPQTPEPSKTRFTTRLSNNSESVYKEKE